MAPQRPHKEPEREPDDQSETSNVNPIVPIIAGLESKIDAAILEIQALASTLRTSDSAQDVLQASEEHTPVTKRRSEDDLRRALKVLASGAPRQRDDDSVEILTDGISEMIRLRQVVYDLIRDSTNLAQRGQSALRNMTERQ